MIIYTQTPDYYQEYLEHGWLKDQAAKVHKYLERWRGKNGKWYYRYATNAIKNAYNKTKFKLTNKHQLSDKQFDDRGYSKSSTYYTSKKGTIAALPAGEHGSRTGNTKAGISAGRKRVADKKRAREKEIAMIREAFSAPEVRARALKNRKNYILKENYWNPKNDKRQAQLDSYKKKHKK